MKRLREDLESRRQELLTAVEAVPTELRNRVGAEGTWSVAMLIEHLVQTEEAITRLVASLLPQARARSADEPFDAGSSRGMSTCRSCWIVLAGSEADSPPATWTLQRDSRGWDGLELLCTT